MGIVVTSYICKVTTQKGFFMHCYIQELQMKSSTVIILAVMGQGL